MIDLSTLPGRLLLVAAVLVVATVAWLLRRRREGRLARTRTAAAGVPDVAERALGSLLASTRAAGDGVSAAVTVVQVSAPACAPCRQAARVWSTLAQDEAGVTHVEVDAEQHPGLLEQLGVWRTPTSFVLDDAGRLVGRVSGAPTPRAARDAVAPWLVGTAA